MRTQPLDPELRDLIDQARSHAGLQPLMGDDSREHDFRDQFWGHACSLAWRPAKHEYHGSIISETQLHEGDVIRVTTGRLVLTEVERPLDPGDQYLVIAKPLKDEVAAQYFKEHP